MSARFRAIFDHPRRHTVLTVEFQTVPGANLVALAYDLLCDQRTPVADAHAYHLRQLLYLEPLRKEAADETPA